ncbi:hypothetical protein JCM8547_000969 [Rhodosporidiobolus lusitaniae]
MKKPLFFSRSSLDVLLLSILVLPAASLAAPASSSNAPTTESTSDGSGSAPNRHSPSFLLFSILCLVPSLPLLLAGHRLFRLTTSLGAGLLLYFIVWVVLANTLSAGGFSEESRGKTGIIVWALCAAGGIVGMAVGAWWWRVGVVAMGGCAGAALGLSVAMMGNDALPVVARWVIIGVLSGLGLVVLPLVFNSIGMIIATALTGSFLLFLGVDLFVNQVEGMSLGLRYILDGNSAHAEELVTYLPPVTTRAFLAVSWCIALLAVVWQWWYFVYRQSLPFLRETYELKSAGSFATPYGQETSTPDFASDYRLPNLPPGLSEEMSIRSSSVGQVERNSMEERYQQAMGLSPTTPEPYFGDSRGTSPLLPVETLRKIERIQHTHPRDLSSPDDPPSRPASILSSAYGQGLRSRPPTFFDEPLRIPAQPAPPVSLHQRKPTPPGLSNSTFPPHSPISPIDGDRTSWVTQDVPVVAVRAPAASRPLTSRRPSVPSSVPVGPDSEDGATVTGSGGAAGRSSSGGLTAGGQAAAAFSSGLQSGEVASLPPTNTRTESGNDISTLLGGGKFSTPPVSSAPPSSSTRQSLPQDVTSASSMAPSRPSGETDRSFATAESALSSQHFPTTPTEVHMVSPLEGPGPQIRVVRDEDDTEELR